MRYAHSLNKLVEIADNKFKVARAIGYLDGLNGVDNREDEVCVDSQCYSAYRNGHDDGFYARLNRK